jgi:hypothetical protein
MFMKCPFHTLYPWWNTLDTITLHNLYFENAIIFSQASGGVHVSPHENMVFELIPGVIAQQVMPLAELSSRARSGGRCFQHMVFCNLEGLWTRPMDENWTQGLLPYAVGQKASPTLQIGTTLSPPILQNASMSGAPLS